MVFGTSRAQADEHESGKVLGDANSSKPSADPSQAASTLLDIVQGGRMYYLWGLLGWQDIRRRYRRSVLGPFWLTISMGVLVGAMGTLYGALLKIGVEDYLPFLAAGFIVWSLISGLIVDGCAAFTDAERIIKQAALPASVHVYRVAWRNLIIFAHNVVIFAVVAVIFSISPGWAGLAALPGLLLICLNGVWIGLMLGLVSARFRDIPQMVASVVQVMFFLTPIIWKPELLPERTPVLDFNPFYHLVEIVRAPMLGRYPAPASWLGMLAMALGGWLLTLLVYRRYRWRLAYWV